MKKYKIYVFLLIAFSWSWLNWFTALGYIAEGINETTMPEFIAFFYIGVYGPSAGALLTTLIYDGFPGVVPLLKKMLIWNVGLKNYLYVIILPLIFLAFGIVLYSGFMGSTGPFDASAFTAIPIVLWLGLYAGPLGEELGWRGFLLPELQKKHSAIKSATLIGVIWFCWHIPLFWAPFGTLVSGGEISLLPVLTYFIMVICLSWIITWLVNNAKGSVLIAILFHLSINAGLMLLFFPELRAEFKTVNLLSAFPMILFTAYIGIKTRLNSKKGINHKD